jgi:hypothetical protein
MCLSDAVELGLTRALTRPEFPIKDFVPALKVTQNLVEPIGKARFEQSFPLPTGQKDLDIDKIADDVCKYAGCCIEYSLGVWVGPKLFLIPGGFIDDLA